MDFEAPAGASSSIGRSSSMDPPARRGSGSVPALARTGCQRPTPLTLTLKSQIPWQPCARPWQALALLASRLEALQRWKPGLAAFGRRSCRTDPTVAAGWLPLTLAPPARSWQGERWRTETARVRSSCRKIAPQQKEEARGGETHGQPRRGPRQQPLSLGASRCASPTPAAHTCHQMPCTHVHTPAVPSFLAPHQLMWAPH